MRKIFGTSVLLLLVLTSCDQKGVLPVEQTSWQTTKQTSVSIHDPSVTLVTNADNQKEFYLFGSHLAEAKSSDLVTWEVPFSTEYENMEDNLLFENTKDTLAETFEWSGYDDADSAGGYNIWAPDVIWSAEYQWADGSTGAYLLYYSASSTWRRSAIGLAVAKTIEGPYSYSDTIIYSGFTKEDSTDGSERNTNYQGTNIPDLIKSGLVAGFNDKWVIEAGQTYNTDYAPNAIDPALFYDVEGKLWLTYGSWSGGIFLLEVDATTGIPKYPGKDATTKDGRVIDRYFGTKISGGFHQSGEGPYIVYDKETGFYYLFVTYGGLSAKGGYNMRLFRSVEPDGPYVDAQGNSPVLSKGVQNSDYGIKLMGNYQFSQQKMGYRAAGHNSAVIDESQWYLIYHTRFNNRGENHEVRVHQMFRNAAGWPVPVPYAYTGDNSQPISVSCDEVAGEYEYLNHGTDNGKTMLKTQKINLTNDGQITGAVTGTWKSKEKGLVTLTINQVVYEGIFYYQSNQEVATNSKVLTFSAIGTNNETIWGSKISSE